MAYGLTATGFVTKRLADIKTEIEDALKDTFGAGINLDAREPFGQIVGIFAEREAAIWEQMEGVYYSQYPDTAEGTSLDNAVAFTGTTRKPRTKSTVGAIAFGTEGTVIPQGSVVSVSGKATSRFVTDAEAEIQAAVDEVQSLIFSAVPDAGSFQIRYDDSASTAALDSTATASDVQDALRAIEGLEDVTVTGSFAAGFVVTFAGDAGAQDQPTLTVENNTLEAATIATTVTVTVNTTGKAAQVAVTLTAETAGAVQAPAGSLTVIETPVSGWDSISNALDAEVGDELESDAELKLRRVNSVQTAGAGTTEAMRSDLLALDDVTAVLVFENKTMSTDADGRPAKSFEVLIEGGDDDLIAATIFQDKPAGIEPYGSTAVTVVDSMGFEHAVEFTRPTVVPIYLELDLTTNARFPLNGETLVKQAMIDYGATLGLGDDVIVIPALVSFLNTVDGITDAVIRIGKAAAPTEDDNVTIALTEVAEFDTSRVSVNIL